MKAFYLDDHSKFCKPSVSGVFNFCETNPKAFLFFVKNNFVLILYHRCLEYGDEYKFKKEIIESVLKNAKIKERHEVRKSVVYDDEFKSLRLRNKPLNKISYDVSYLYSDSAGKQYAIVTEIEILDKVANHDELKKSYENALMMLKEKGYSYLEDQLTTLYHANCAYVEQIEKVKTIDYLITKINKQCRTQMSY